MFFLQRPLTRIPFQSNQIRTIFKRSAPPPKLWKKEQVDKKVYQVLFTYSNIEEDKVSLYSSIEKDLLVDERQRYGLYLDLLNEFELSIAPYRSLVRDWQSGKEAADWIAANLEEKQRLIDC
ncbi:hypothetical protein BC833DRAFT_561512 [Globomyces pollinis-pini]|nr:hypothetical protein BC833DRAFT_561512 [Globomyces pollinis-pini]